MRVKNRKCIRHLSLKALLASFKRNMIAITAIALTTLLFTSLFTLGLSINSTYQTYTFRQVGGRNHGTFKEVNIEQIKALSSHPKVKASGVRINIGINNQGIFAKAPAEIGYFDSNSAAWSYHIPDFGRLPESGNEIAMDVEALRKMGITPKIGTEITLNYTVNDKEQSGIERIDTFILTGWWEYDEISPVHAILVSREYVKQVEAESIAEGLHSFRTDLDIMLASSINIRNTMEKIETELGYQWEDASADNCVRIGVNWGYTSAELASNIDLELVVSMAALLILIIFTGYLIIYNIFQISVTGDIRFYGLLKTIGTTPQQLKAIIRNQAMLLSAVGIPIGIIGGYIVGAVLTPFMLSGSFYEGHGAVSTSPVIFAGSGIFALITVFMSCAKPGKIAAKVSPIEAAKYTGVSSAKKSRSSTNGAKVYRMAFANLGRNRLKTGLVILSLSLAVVLLNTLYTFVGGFDMEKYLGAMTAADFIVGNTEYFNFACEDKAAALDDDMITDIGLHTENESAGKGYAVSGMRPSCWISEEMWREQFGVRYDKETAQRYMEHNSDKDGNVMSELLIEGLDRVLFEKITVVEGSIEPLFLEDRHAIAIQVNVDDYGNVADGTYPEIGDTLRTTFVKDGWYIDSRTGEKSDENTPSEYLEWHTEDSYDIEYIVCAHVIVPYSMSFRMYSGNGYNAILPIEKLQADSTVVPHPVFYLFDTPNEEAELEAEHYLAELTAGDISPVMYESKDTKRAEFEEFQNMFLFLGGILCFIVGFVGLLNFLNAMITGILSRQRESAVMQAIGMTRRQLKLMLVWEGIFYALGAAIFSLALTVVMSPLAGKFLEGMFWFYSYRFNILPVFAAAAFFVVLGIVIPLWIYPFAARTSIVERLRESW